MTINPLMYPEQSLLNYQIKILTEALSQSNTNLTEAYKYIYELESKLNNLNRS